MSRFGLRRWWLLPVFCAVVTPSSAFAQYVWKAIRLHVADSYTTEAHAAWGPLQGGFVYYSGQPGRGAIWRGTSEGWMDLTPPWADLGIIHGMDASGQVGQVGPAPNTYHAALWRGTPESAVDLNPGGPYFASSAYAIQDDQQVGQAAHASDGLPHAALWRGTPESFVDLHPPGAQWSEAFATDGEYQGGWFVPAAGGLHAIIWNGTAQSAVDLHPPGAVSSAVRDMAPGVQVGYVRWVGQSGHAALWRGTVASLVDLNPPGTGKSELYATDGTIHGGAAWFGGLGHATIWLDGADNVVDLHPLLGPGYAGSVVRAVWTDGRTIRAAGIAYPSTAPDEAWVWIGTRIETDAPKRR
ncbi:MAG: hypothetical protein KJZ54_09965 [Phycisphaerales bacterium]|nr:hypothetical protein [Phycisphaerales bacterium]